MRQASRRCWRIGQRQPVEETYLVYEGTLQAEALALVAAKMRSSLMVEGQLSEEGLAALEGDGEDMLLALSRRMSQEHADDRQSLEALFVQAGAIEAEADDLLIDGEWNAEGMPALVEPQDDDSGDDAVELWWRIFAGDTRNEQAETANGAAEMAVPPGRVVSFEELAHLIQRPKQSRMPSPDRQLSLFDG